MEEIAAARPRDALAFSLLDNHVRLAILDSLYERTVEPGPLASDAAYSAVKSDVGVEDSGRFSYHLDKLTDWFVTKTDDGYRLAEPGRKVVRLRRTRTLAADPAVEAEPVDAECYRCEGDVEASYDAGYLLVRCRECEGLVDHPLVPEGTLSALAYPPSGVSEVGISTAFERSHRRLAHYFRAMGDGFCPNCGRDVTVTFPPTTRHDPARRSDSLTCATTAWSGCRVASVASGGSPTRSRRPTTRNRWRRSSGIAASSPAGTAWPRRCRGR